MLDSESLLILSLQVAVIQRSMNLHSGLMVLALQILNNLIVDLVVLCSQEILKVVYGIIYPKPVLQEHIQTLNLSLYLVLVRGDSMLVILGMILNQVQLTAILYWNCLPTI